VKPPAVVSVDFVGTRHTSVKSGMLLCALGLSACASLGWMFQNGLAARNALQTRLAAVARPQRASKPLDTRAAAAAANIEKQLWIPWSALLAEIESASADVASTVSLLEVEPDASKHVIRITAEARTLTDALAYLERLQKSPVLRYPMLDSHELRKDDPEHPVRVKLSAEWRT
jgi:hypothetical protein